MIRFFISLLVFSVAFSCNSGGKKVNKEEHAAEIPQKDLSPSDSLIKILKADNYHLKIDTTLRGYLEFAAYDSALKEVADIKVDGLLVTINATKAAPISNNSYYTRFTIQEISLNDSVDQKDLEEKIKAIIYNTDDLFNDKVYDHALFYDNKLFYFKTDVRMYKETVSHYYRQLERLISR